MAWVKVVPSNSGGGRKRQEPSARVYPDGQIVFNAALGEMLGYPERITVQVSTDAPAFRVQPTTPDDSGGFSFSGGGNTPHRIGARTLVKSRPELAGNYTAKKLAGGIVELLKEKER